MKKSFILLFTLLTSNFLIKAQADLPVVGLCIAAPSAENVEEFVEFIDNELAPSGINTLILRVDFNYDYKLRPELRDENPLSFNDVKSLVNVCEKNNINLIPQVNLLGHQSWASTLNKLLEVYPEFDETPHVKLPENYKWPNSDGLYCKSYCPLHPKVHEVVYDLIDEIVEVFEAKDFHAGMDEVFYIADKNCSRCKGMDPAELFAGEVTLLSNHLNKTDKKLWIWGDRLIEGELSGIGMWEGSTNNTEKAIDLIPKNVVICDWHYEKAIPTPAYFSLKGLNVIACSWRKPSVANEQVKMMHDFRSNSPDKMRDNFLGVMHTYWSSAKKFMDDYKTINPPINEEGSEVECFKEMVESVKKLNQKNN
jgi:hypothetical protein